MHWAMEHRSRLILYGSLVIVVLVLAISFYAVRSSQEQQASMALANAMEVYGAPVVPVGTPPEPGVTMFNTAQERATAANKEFAKIADKYSTKSGRIARYMEGVTYSDMGDYSNAEKDLKEVADKGNSDLANLAKFALASVYRENNRDSEAINEYQEIAAHPSRSVGKTMANLELASLYSKNQPDKARILLQQIVKDNPDSEVAQIASQKIAELK